LPRPNQAEGERGGAREEIGLLQGARGSSRKKKKKGRWIEHERKAEITEGKGEAG